jgi:2-polyprenyl-3-methyl-5-hydroxy-6-metoxy-1,4-benzoquinol methylase
VARVLTEQAPAWTRDDTEAVVCCLCHREGRPVHDLDPFGVVRCPRCTLVFVSPRLRPEALQRLYDAPAYHEGVYGTPSRFSPAMALQRRWTKGRLDLAEAELARPTPGARLLEIGAGHGLFLAAARERGFDVTGVELSTTAAAHARDELGLTVHPTQLEDAPLDGRFDVVCAWDTLEHVPDPVAFWRTVRGVLADDGVVLFSTPYISSVPGRLLGRRWWTLKPTEHIWHFTRRTHRAVAAEAGLQVTRFVRSPLAAANFGRLDSLVGVARVAG